MTPLGEDNGKFAPAPSRALLHAPLSLAGFNLYPFTVINDNHNSFADFRVSFQWVTQPKGGHEEPQGQPLLCVLGLTALRFLCFRL